MTDQFKFNDKISGEAYVKTKLHSLVRAGLGEKIISGSSSSQSAAFAHWPAEFYGLNQSPFYMGLTPKQKTQVLNLCGRDLLREAYFIEKIGMVYASKMSLLAEKIDERIFYCTMAADEARHFASISSFFGEDSPEGEESEFVQLLYKVVAQEDRLPLIIVIQIVLEGWGLTHYRELLKSCESEALGEHLMTIIRDEARHHGSGLVLVENQTLTPDESAAAQDILEKFLYMIQVGPYSVLKNFERMFGKMTFEQRREFLADLESVKKTQSKLDILKGLLENSMTCHALIEKLADKGCFASFSLSEQAEALS